MVETNDLNISERNEFHEWYLEKYNEEYPYTYSQMFRKLAGKEGQQEFEKVLPFIVEYKKENIIKGARTIGNALKEPYRKIIVELLSEIGIDDAVTHQLVWDLIPLWKYLSDNKKNEAGVTIAGRYRLAKFLVLMDELSKMEDEY